MTKTKEFIKEKLFENVMSSGGMDGYHNYMGHDWKGWLCGLAKTRDSDALSRSNYRIALEMLGGELKGIVETRSVNHWACGYIDQIMVKADNTKAVAKLQAIYDKLDGYPVLDESDFSQEEMDEQDETFRCFNGFVKEFLEHFNLDHTVRDARRAEIEEITNRIYSDDCGYRGLENAWVNSKSIERYFEHDGAYELPRLARDGNRVAKLLIAMGYVTPKN
jgi:hypothetical protein